jgi:WS/DGAT/MGAT family acyltransferase
MKQLGGIDASFLYMETPETPMHVAGLTLFEPPADFSSSFYDHFREFFLSRIHLAPIFEKKLARTVLELDHPGWVDARDLDFDYHLQHATLPAPGTWAQLERMVADLHARPLDRARPLWQFTIIDGLDEGAVALYSKVHHAAVDGGAGMAIAAALYDISPTPRAVKPAAPKPEPARKPSIEERALLGINDFVQNIVRQQLKVVETIPQVLTAVTDMLLPKTAGDGKPSAGGLPPLPDMAGMLAPKTPFNVTITAERAYAARSISLTDAKAIAKATGAKINDVVMAVCAGALRVYLKERKALPRKPLIAFVPISLREAGNSDSNNQVFGMNCQIATQIADPLERLAAIRSKSGESKALAGSVKDIAPKDYSLLGAPLLLPGLMQIYGFTGLADVLPSAVNLTISNTMGPPFPLFCAGAKILALYPVSIPIHGVALNMTVQSYQDRLDFGLTAGGKAVPDIARLADLLVPALAELKEAAQNLAAKAG